jgi:phage FluMu protein Com
MLVMEMLGFNALFTIVSDEAMALQHFSGAAVPPASVPVTPQAVPEAAAPARSAGRVLQAPVPTVAAAVFPLAVSCPRCRLSLKLPEAGRYKCPRCTSVAMVESSGEMKFFASRRAKPIEISLPAIPQLADAIGDLVTSAAVQVGFAGPSADNTARAVVTACRSVAEHACGNDPNSVFHLIIIPNGRQLTVKISDFGTPLSFPPQGPAADARFGSVAKVMSVEHTPNPVGGNLFTLTKTVE